jgi:alkylation response protein AidB-like acyl-CoA dehydrogenase
VRDEHPAPPLAEPSGPVVDCIRRARDTGEDIAAALAIAATVGTLLPAPGHGRTLERWSVLAALARANLTAARVVEAHTDALAILAEAKAEPVPAGTTWGVFAAESPGQLLSGEPAADGTFELSGVKPWCSLGDVLDRALVTAHVTDGRQLFAIDLRDPRVQAEPARQWVARGLRTVSSVPLHCDRLPAVAVGSANWYLVRDGFAWGGIGVAACWYGGALGLADALYRTAARRCGPLDGLHVGTVDAQLYAAAAALRDAATRIDGGAAGGAAGELLAAQVRAVVAEAVESVVRQVGHALGPAPLAFDAEYAGRVADLELYVRQHHAERDLDALGQLLRPDAGP